MKPALWHRTAVVTYLLSVMALLAGFGFFIHGVLYQDSTAPQRQYQAGGICCGLAVLLFLGASVLTLEGDNAD